MLMHLLLLLLQTVNTCQNAIGAVPRMLTLTA